MNKNKSEYDDNSRRMKQRGKNYLGLGILIGTLTVVSISLLSIYIVKERYYSSHFVAGTVINDIDVSGMTIEELNDRISEYTLTIMERNSEGELEEETITGSQIGLELASTDDLEEILESQSGGKWISKKGEEVELTDFVEFDEGMWEKKMEALQCFSDDFVVEPEDAHLSEYNEDTKSYEIVASVEGNQLDSTKAKEYLSQAVRELATEVNLEELDCYESPEILADDEDLLTLQTNLNYYVNVAITYTFGDDVESLDGDLIHDWLIINDDNTVTLDSDQVSDYVSTLRKKYDTIFRSRTFMTSYDKEITIDSGDYGWWMNYTQEAQELEAMIEAGESGERTPVYYQTAAQYGSQDYGNTYVEVNLTAQHMFYYEDGELVLESDFVSGNASKSYDTPEGVYGVTYKQRNATLVGEDYETPVSYWMPFNNHVGLHDATWRSEFGSDIYETSGSHGCVNLPYKIAKKLYSMIEQGTPVICYNLKGTESDSTTKQSAKEIAQSVIDRIDEIGTVTKDSQKLIERARTLYEEISSAAKKEVSNYDTLVAAEEAYEELTK